MKTNPTNMLVVGNWHPPPRERGGIPSVGSFRFNTPTEQPASANLKGCSRSETGAGGTAGGAKPPVLLFSTMYGVQTLFLPQGRRQALANSELLSVVFSSSRAQHRFIIGTDRSPDWFRWLSYCLGRTGRHRRTGGNRSVSNQFLCYCVIASHLNMCILKFESSDDSRILEGVTARIHGL